jgi:Domain of unknown function (DUF4394)
MRLSFLLAMGLLSGLSTLSAGTIYLTNSSNQLVRLDSATPGTIQSTQAITGLQGGESVLGIDFRPATGELFGLGSSNRLYVIDPVTGAAVAVGASGAFTLVGNSFGVDFNPTVDRVRVVSDTGQNLRLNPATGGLAATDTNLGGGATGAFAAAYTNSFNGALTTTLYSMDAATDALYIQNPPNNGTLVLVGALGLNVSQIGGFDIDPAGNVAFAAFQSGAGGGSSLYSINLTTGAASLIGAIGNGQQIITGLASAPVPEPSAILMVSGALLALGLVRRRA